MPSKKSKEKLIDVTSLYWTVNEYGELLTDSKPEMVEPLWMGVFVQLAGSCTNNGRAEKDLAIVKVQGD